jgi:mannuronan 5-epimerase
MNYVHDESKCILVSQSHRNEIYNNQMSDWSTGIRLLHDASENSICNSTIANFKLGIHIEDIGPANQIYSNAIINATENAIDIEDGSVDVTNNVSKSNEIINSQSIGKKE